MNDNIEKKQYVLINSQITELVAKAIYSEHRERVVDVDWEYTPPGWHGDPKTFKLTVGTIVETDEMVAKERVDAEASRKAITDLIAAMNAKIAENREKEKENT